MEIDDDYTEINKKKEGDSTAAEIGRESKMRRFLGTKKKDLKER